MFIPSLIGGLLCGVLDKAKSHQAGGHNRRDGHVLLRRKQNRDAAALFRHEWRCSIYGSLLGD